MKRPCMALSLLVASLTGSGIATGPAHAQGAGEQVERMHSDVCPLVADDCFGLGYGYGTCGEPLVGFRGFPESLERVAKAEADQPKDVAAEPVRNDSWFGCEATGECCPQREVADFPYDPIGNDAYWNEWDYEVRNEMADITSPDSLQVPDVNQCEMDRYRTGYDASYDRAVYGAEVRGDVVDGAVSEETPATVEWDDDAYWAAFADDADPSTQRTNDDYWAEYARSLELYRAEQQRQAAAEAAERDAYWEAYEAEMIRIREESQQLASNAADEDTLDVDDDAYWKAYAALDEDWGDAPVDADSADAQGPAPIADAATRDTEYGTEYDDYGYEEYYDEYYEDYYDDYYEDSYGEYYDDEFERSTVEEPTVTDAVEAAIEPEVQAEVTAPEAAIAVAEPQDIVDGEDEAEADAVVPSDETQQPVDDFGYGDAYYDEYGYDYYDQYYYEYDDGWEASEPAVTDEADDTVEEVVDPTTDGQQLQAAKEVISTMVDEMARSPLLSAANASVRQVADQVRDIQLETSVVRSWERMLSQLQAARTQPSLQFNLVESPADPCDDDAYWACDQWDYERAEVHAPVAEPVRIAPEWRLQMQRRAVLAVAESLAQTGRMLQSASEQLRQVADEQAAEISRRQADDTRR